MAYLSLTNLAYTYYICRLYLYVCIRKYRYIVDITVAYVQISILFKDKL